MSYTVHHKLMTLNQLEDYAERLMIPLWQRDYAWTQPQWTSLAETLCSASPKRPAFLGTIVLVKRQDQAASPEGDLQPFFVFDVVDGQQRLTTLHHLLSLLLEQKGLPLFRGRLALPQAVEPPDDLKGFAGAFREAVDYLRELPSDWTEAVMFAVTILEPDMADARCASRLGAQFFTRLNRQRRMLSALDEAKARLVLDLPDEARADDKSSSVAEEWERLRRTVWTLDGLGLKEKRSPERLQRQELRFMRILLTLLRTVVHEEDPQGFTVNPEDPDASFRNRFVLDTPENRNAFLQKLRTFNDLSTASDDSNARRKRLRSGLLLARNKEDETLLFGSESESSCLPDVLALLQLQAFLHGYYQERWLESGAFAVVVSGLTDETASPEERIRKTLKALEGWLARQTREEIENNKEDADACGPTTWLLLWREWVLLRGIWSRTEPYFGVVKEALDAWAKADAAFEEVLQERAASAFFDLVRQRAPRLKNELPDRWAGQATEHWVSLERGEQKQRKELDRLLNAPHNFAHIAESLNSSWRNASIGTKTVRLMDDDKAEKAWPTLIVCAALTRAQEKAGVPLPPDQLTEASLQPYIDRMKAFWAVIDRHAEDVRDS